ncbi:uncharacterized protein LOC135815807 [Sycon ciliatum]|uniref:uncharacterized protein LOC135815807 n=1 Tax=Sycon ciliatum TaxID=27933 RepID=UPI0031F6DA54
MHRGYQPTKPATNKVLAKRWDDQKFSSHRDRVRGAKPMVDTRPPKVQSHLAVKMKKLQLEEERNAVIDRDNRMLLEKMSTIMHTRGRIDDRNDYEHKSLNRLQRQRELMSIMRENQKMVGRLKDRTQKPNYDNSKMASDWTRKQQYASSIAAYPPDWYEQMQASGQVRQRPHALTQTAPAVMQARRPLPPIGSSHQESVGEEVVVVTDGDLSSGAAPQSSTLHSSAVGASSGASRGSAHLDDDDDVPSPEPLVVLDDSPQHSGRASHASQASRGSEARAREESTERAGAKESSRPASTQSHVSSTSAASRSSAASKTSASTKASEHAKAPISSKTSSQSSVSSKESGKSATTSSKPSATASKTSIKSSSRTSTQSLSKAGSSTPSQTSLASKKP